MTTKEKIINTATNLFLTKGYDTVSIEEIIRNTGIAKGTFYHHFKSKEELLETIVELMAEESLQQLKQILEDDSLSILEKTKRITNKATQYKLDRLPVIIETLKTWLNPASLTMRKKLEELTYKKTLPFYKEYIIQGQKEGTFDIGRMNPSNAARFIITLSLAITTEVAEYLLGLAKNPEYEQKLIELMDSYQYAYERILGLQEGSLDFRTDEFISAAKKYLVQGEKHGNS
ncbi:TetR/AcrR family transcriptional regulator [Spirochaetia bacterium 38H-sp]|uniref:TetR/AcrR family transcriptional regulator n=1 Tax=Rarispira pelagica TaxID=3141764 RepID=A0ABU9UA64_9SPIR